MRGSFDCRLGQSIRFLGIGNRCVQGLIGSANQVAGEGSGLPSPKELRDPEEVGVYADFCSRLTGGTAGQRDRIDEAVRRHAFDPVTVIGDDDPVEPPGEEGEHALFTGYVPGWSARADLGRFCQSISWITVG